MAERGWTPSHPPCGEPTCPLHGDILRRPARADRAAAGVEHLRRVHELNRQRRALVRLRGEMRRRRRRAWRRRITMYSWPPALIAAVLMVAVGIVLAVPEEAEALGTGSIAGTVTTMNTEADIVAGGVTIEITLAGGQDWVLPGAAFDAERQNIINGMTSAQGEAGGWNAQVKPTLLVTDVVRISDSVVTVTLPAFGGYDLTADETIAVNVPASALQSAAPLDNTPSFSLLAGTAAVSGTIQGGANFEGDIVQGGGTIVLTLTNEKWVGPGAAFDAIRGNIITGIDSGQAEATGWDAVVKAGIPVGNVIRTSDTVVTITLPAFPTYNITAPETITVTVPAVAIGGTGNIISAPVFTVLAASAVLSGTIQGGLNTEGNIATGGGTIVLTLTNDRWAAAGATFDAERQNIINGLDSAQAEAGGWDTVVKAGIAVGNAVRTSDQVVTITLPAFGGYNITATETITAAVPASAIASASNLIAGPSFNVLAASAALSGTIQSGLNTEGDIASGGGTVILTLTNDTWVAAGATFDAQRQNIINGLDSAQAEAAGWDAVVKAGIPVGSVVRTSNTVVTITLPVFVTYNITASETISVTVPSSAIMSAGSLAAPPGFTLLPGSAAASGTIQAGANTEGDVAVGGATIVLTLTNDRWATAGATFDAQRQNILNGLVSAQAEGTGWNAVVPTGIPVGNVVRTSNTVVTITFPALPGYDITANETVQITVPASAIASAGAHVAPQLLTIQFASAAASGTIQAGTNTEGDIGGGGATIVLTLTNDVWAAAGATFDAQRQNIINGLDSAQAEAAGWDAVVQAGIPVGNVVRTSSSVVTITLPVFPTYDITANETITITIPPSALASTGALVAPQQLTILFASAAGVTGTIQGGSANTEGHIVAGGGTIIITLLNDVWMPAGAAFDAERQNIINGLTSAGGEASGWNAVVRAGIAVTDAVRTSNTVVTITLPPFPTYNVEADESITVTIPASAISSAGALVANPPFPVLAARADLGGTLLNGFPNYALDIKGGGDTIVITLTNDTWDATVGADNAITQAIIDGIVSLQSEERGWANTVAHLTTFVNVDRTSATVVTITLPPVFGYELTASEELVLTVPPSALTSSGPVRSIPNFGIAPGPPGTIPLGDGGGGAGGGGGSTSGDPDPEDPLDEDVDDLDDDESDEDEQDDPADFDDLGDPVEAVGDEHESSPTATSTIDGGLDTAITMTGTRGSRIVARVPAGALSVGNELMLTPLNAEALAAIAPAPEGSTLAAGFAIHAESGVELLLPLGLYFAVDIDELPVYVRASELLFAVWTGSEWELVDADWELGPKGSPSLRADTHDFAAFALLYGNASFRGAVGAEVIHVRTEGLAPPQALVESLGDAGCRVRVLAQESGDEWDVYVNTAPQFVNRDFPPAVEISTEVFVRCDPQGLPAKQSNPRVRSSSDGPRSRRRCRSVLRSSPR